VEVVGLLMVAERRQVAGEVVCRDESGGVVVAQPPPVGCVGAFAQRERRMRFAAGQPVAGGPVEQPGQLSWDVVERPVGVDSSQHMR
jgi:hypothetical protein